MTGGKYCRVTDVSDRKAAVTSSVETNVSLSHSIAALRTSDQPELCKGWCPLSSDLMRPNYSAIVLQDDGLYDAMQFDRSN